MGSWGDAELGGLGIPSGDRGQGGMGELGKLGKRYIQTVLLNNLPLLPLLSPAPLPLCPSAMTISLSCDRH